MCVDSGNPEKWLYLVRGEWGELYSVRAQWGEKESWPGARLRDRPFTWAVGGEGAGPRASPSASCQGTGPRSWSQQRAAGVTSVSPRLLALPLPALPKRTETSPVSSAKPPANSRAVELRQGVAELSLVKESTRTGDTTQGHVKRKGVQKVNQVSAWKGLRN